MKLPKNCEICNEKFGVKEIVAKYENGFICECCTEDIEERIGVELTKYVCNEVNQ